MRRIWLATKVELVASGHADMNPVSERKIELSRDQDGLQPVGYALRHEWVVRLHYLDAAMRN